MCIYVYIHTYEKKISKHQKAFATFDQERMSFDMKYKTKSQHEHGRIHQTY